MATSVHIGSSCLSDQIQIRDALFMMWPRAWIGQCEKRGCLSSLSDCCSFLGWVLLSLGFLFDVVAGADMLRMLRCGFAVFVACMWRVCCWWVTHAHACGGSCFLLSVLSFLVLPFLFFLLVSSAPLSFLASLSLSQWKVSLLVRTDLGRTS